MTDLRVGIIGAGQISQGNHIPFYQKLNKVKIVAISDVNKERAAKLAKEFGISKVYTDHKQMLDKENLDIISVCTPNFLHASQTIDSLEAGCHVLCEKPMALNAKEAEEMVRVAKTNKRKLMIPLRFQFTSEAQYLKKLIDKEELGDIYYIKSGWIRQQTIRTEKDWFARKEKSGGGCLIDIGVYMVSVALWLMNYPQVLSISASTYQKLGRQAKSKSYDVDDLASAFIRLDNGATLFIEVSWALNAAPGIYTILCGEEGGAEIRYPSLKIYKEKKGKIETIVPETGKKISFIDYFVDCIRKDKEPEANGEQGLKVMKVLDGIYQSAKEKREIYLV